MDTKPMLHSEHLEQLIDGYGLPRLLAELASIAYRKAANVQERCTDKPLADAWGGIGHKLADLGHTIPRL